MKPGRKVDALVAELMGWTPVVKIKNYDGFGKGPRLWYGFEKPDGGEMHYPPPYSEDMAAAWPVHKMACGWIFSKRRTYLKELEGAILDRIASEVNLGYWVSVAWPDLLMFLEPVDICLAVLRTEGVSDSSLCL